jgi:uncharacterized protein YutE (UPF0331/DUF86 family)
MLDRPLIDQHLQNMEEALTNLARYRSLRFEEFEKDLSLVWATERGLQILIQNLLDIGAHILASEIRNDWDDYGEIISKLGQHGVLPRVFAEKIKGMAGLRNILVHEYLRVDTKKIYDLLVNKLEDFTEFMRSVDHYLENETKRGSPA